MVTIADPKVRTTSGVVQAVRPAVRLAVVVFFIAGLSVTASDKPPDDYRAAMKSLEAATDIMRHHARMVEPGGDFGYDWIEKDAATVKGALQQTLDFWTARDVKRAMRFAQDAMSDAALLEKAARNKHFDGVVAGVAGVLAACEPCHSVYREQLPDGSFAIR